MKIFFTKRCFLNHPLLEKKQKPNSGFTLIEMLIYIALVGIVAVSFVVFSLSISEARNKNYVVQEVQANGRVALDLINQRIREAGGVNTGSSTFDSDPGVLSLSMADSAKDPTIVNLDQDDGTLQIKEGASSAVAITSDEVKVTNLVFTDLTPSGERRSIRIQITLEYNNTSSDVEFNYSKSWQTAASVRR